MDQSTADAQRLEIQNAPMDMRRCNARLWSHRCHIARLGTRRHKWLPLMRLSRNVLEDSECTRQTLVLTIAPRGISCTAAQQTDVMQY